MGRRKRRMQDAKRPLLSIFVSVYNLENYIEECLDSILQQPFQDYEILLFDNGSIDRSIEICTGYAQRYPDKIRYYKLPLPTVVGRPHELACRRMRGRYFMQIDGDDYLAPGALQQISDCIQQNAADIIMGTFTSVAEPGSKNIYDAAFEEEKINGIPYQDAVEYLAELPQFHIVLWRYILKRRVVYKLSANEKRLHRKKRIGKKILKRKKQDSILLHCLKKYNWNLGLHGESKVILMIFQCGQSIFFLKEPFYLYRQRHGSISALPPALSGNFLAASGLLSVLWVVEWETWSRHSPFLNKMCIQYMEMYRQLCFLNTKYEEAALSDTIQTHRKSFQYLTRCETVELSTLYGLIQQFGETRGLACYRERQTEKLREGCKGFSGKTIYVFPTGFCGEATAELLTSEGVPVLGFLDNNPDKDEACIRGRICHVPQKLLGISDQEKQNTAVVISTSYPKLSPVLQNQLIALGIPERNIYIR